MISRLLAKLLLALVGRIHIVHREKSARPCAYILAANHISHFDPPVLSVATRRKIDWMAMGDLFRSKIFAHWARAIDTFPTDRERVDRASVKIALARLQRGHVVGIFPEGGIRDGARSVLEGAPLDAGVASLARLGVDSRASRTLRPSHDARCVHSVEGEEAGVMECSGRTRTCIDSGA